jgi:hypothetical protein
MMTEAEFNDRQAKARATRELIGTLQQEQDPNGKGAHEAGAKLDAGKIRPSLILRDMSRALLAVAEVATQGAEKYSEGGWLEVPDGIARYTDAGDRHRLFASIDGPRDPNSGKLHAAHEAWNALAKLELILRESDAFSTVE